MDSFVRFKQNIFDEITFRAFSKRQKSIIDFIVRLSWGCQKEFALIPRYTASFELAGVPRTHIKKELSLLANNHVIFWNKNFNTFKLNENIDSWTIPHYKTFNRKMFDVLLNKNLTACQKVHEIGTRFTKHELFVDEKSSQKMNKVHKTGTQKFTKDELFEPENQSPAKITTLPKDSIKDNIYISKIPTVQEVKTYCSERNNNIDAERFHSFYSSKGWMIGKNKITDWKACVRTWESNNKEKKQESVWNFMG